MTVWWRSWGSSSIRDSEKVLTEARCHHFWFIVFDVNGFLIVELWVHGPNCCCLWRFIKGLTVRRPWFKSQMGPFCVVQVWVFVWALWFPLTVQKHPYLVTLRWSHRWVYEWLMVSVWPCNGVANHAGCTLPPSESVDISSDEPLVGKIEKIGLIFSQNINTLISCVAQFYNLNSFWRSSFKNGRILAKPWLSEQNEWDVSLWSMETVSLTMYNPIGK